jgi:hypothetical protein
MYLSHYDKKVRCFLLAPVVAASFFYFTLSGFKTRQGKIKKDIADDGTLPTRKPILSAPNLKYSKALVQKLRRHLENHFGKSGHNLL